MAACSRSTLLPPSHQFAAPADAIGYAERDNIDWILHIDTDELLYPGGSNGFSLQRILGNYAQDVDTVVFPNYEAMPESENVQDPFTEVCSPAPLSLHAGLAAQAGNPLVPGLMTFWAPKGLLCCSREACPLSCAQWDCCVRRRPALRDVLTLRVQGQLAPPCCLLSSACCPPGY